LTYLIASLFEIVLVLSQAIDTLTDLTDYAAKVDAEIIPAFKKSKKEKLKQKAIANMRHVNESEVLG
jgi:hypothetical protein